MAKESDTPAEVCPVDHATRSAWLKSNSAKTTVFPGATPEPSPAKPTDSCDSSTIDQSPAPAPRSLLSKLTAPASDVPSSLALDREVSTIPRASAVDHAEKPANSEKESGVSASGNWIYPSEKMFFEAMKRKGYQSEAKDMKTIVPIHNAVNERAWKEIKEWERPYGSQEKCGGPRLHSFLGLSRSMTPKARFNTLLGYTAPFDRHDWVVDRCGTKVEYVIDFYAGRNDAGDGKLNFFLDVRPKLNSLEGWKMRGSKILGLV
ncbi:cytochrome c/c1 heme lyase [Phlyctema vagabunda]|uniref:Holocytochrome c-type synthase n=1 Tax=Phlyctema vagabunda TaxID=108571 RepID=A0ABR4PWH4_9HELO